MIRVATALSALLLAGCSMTVTMMPRDSGRHYTGQVTGAGGGSGTMSVALDGASCTGPLVTVASNETFGFFNAFGSNTRGVAASSFGSGYMAGDRFAKGILSCTDGSGLRCDVSGRMGKGGGICVDDRGRVYDVVMQM